MATTVNSGTLASRWKPAERPASGLVAVGVAASWIAATGLFMLGWALR